MLALLLLLHHAAAKDGIQESHVIQKIDVCPDVGYYFKRELKPNAIESVCHLCFCQDNSTAVCGLRKNSRCDVKNYDHLGRKRRYTRNRRSPGFSDIFFRDAARDVFDRNTPEQCKPFESSISDGCPPADWCIGCTVCDCDANGRWDCHILSFCPDDKGKKKMRKRRGFLRNKVVKSQLPKKPKVNTTKKPINKLTKKPTQKQQQKQTKKQPVKGKKPQVKQNKSKTNKLQIKQYKGIPKKGSPLKKKQTQTNNIRMPQKNKAKSNTKIIQKSKKSNAHNKKEKSQTLNANESALKNVAQTILKKVMASVEKIVIENHSKLNTRTEGKILQKRSMPPTKNRSKNPAKNIKSKSMNKRQNKVFKKDKKRDSKNKARSKREIPRLINASFYSQKGVITNTTDTGTMAKPRRDEIISQNLNNDTILVTRAPTLATKFDYFKYSVDFDAGELNSNNNKSVTKMDNFLILNHSSYSPIEVILDAKRLSQNESIINNDVINYNITKGNKLDKEIYSLLKTMKLSNKSIWNISNNNKSESVLNQALKNNVTCGKMCKLTKIFKKVIGLDKKRTTKRKNNRTKSNIMKYWKKIYRQVFQKNKSKHKPVKHIRQPFCKRKMITTICKHLKYCQKQPMSKMLSSKLDLLKAESDKILKSIRSIKGLLKLLNKDAKNLNCNSTIMRKQFSDNDFKMLNSIIKNNYDEFNFGNLTTTESTQVAYIKQNTKIFIESVESFAKILHDIIKVLTYRNISDVNQYNRKLNTIKVISNDTVQEQLYKIKKLLVNYNLVQNKFLKQMYDAIMTLAPKTNVRIEKEKDIKVSGKYLQKNDTIAIQNYTKTIIKNLRKLKNLAQKLSFKNRRKRAAIGDDDAIQYLLILMEYLLKQNKPLNVSPVNDGIDLLIEAIKSAPDIKPIKKKVLDYALVKKEIATTEVVLAFSKNRDTNEKKVISNYKISKFKTFESIDEDEEDSDLFKYDKKLLQNSELKTGDNYDLEELKNDTINSTTHSLNAKFYTTEKNEKNGDETSDPILAKLGAEISEDNKRYEVFIDDKDDDDDDDDDEGVLSTTHKSSENEVTSANVRYRPERTTVPANIKEQSKNKKLSLNWIEENQEEEQRELSRLIETTTQGMAPTTQAVMQAVTRTIRKPVGRMNKYNDPISSMSRESVEEDRKKTRNDKSEYVMYNKQMNLLNSLDYGTEKSGLEADSKEDKSNLESFPLYFV